MLIRLATPEDAAGINAIYRPFVTDSAVSFELEPPSDESMAERITFTLRQYPWLVSHSASMLLGYAYASRYRERPAYQWAVETAVYVNGRCRRTGIGRALYQKLFAILRRQGYYTAYAGIALPNEASAALHQTMGFELIGTYRAAGYKLGAWHDVSWWQRPLRDYDFPSTPPKALFRLGAAIQELTRQAYWHKKAGVSGMGKRYAGKLPGVGETPGRPRKGRRGRFQRTGEVRRWEHSVLERQSS
jgi:L-amino acid N-acyltransferase YncA